MSWTAHAGAGRLAPLTPLLLAGACVATDVVATQRRADACGTSACERPNDAGAPTCRAQACSALEGQAAICANAGALVQAGDHCDEGTTPPTSRFALCSCTDLVSGSALSADAFDGTLTHAISRGAAIGVNGDLNLSGGATIDGALHVVGKHDLAPSVQTDAVLSEAAPCNCDEDRLLDIGSLVQARERDNDNASVGLSASTLDGLRATQQLDLPCGRYFFTRLKGDHPLHITTHGNVAIFVQNNIELSDSLSIQTADRGEVDVFVAGDVGVGGSLMLGGDPNTSARVNLYMASRGTLDLRGSATIIGNLYAPHAELVSLGIFEQYGSLFLRRAAPNGEMHLHYDTEAASPVQCVALP